MLKDSNALALCPPPERRNLFTLLPFKQALAAEFGVEKGFEIYRSIVEFQRADRLQCRRITSLYDFAAAHATSFEEVFPSGEPFSIAAPPIVGPNNRPAITGQARAFFVACLRDAHIRSKSAVISVGDLAIVDYQGNELRDLDDQIDLDPAVFHAAGEFAWTMDARDERDTIEIDSAFGSLLGPNNAAFGHWIWEYLPKYLTAVTSGALPRVPVLIDASMPKTHRQALELVTRGDVEIVELAPFARAKVHDLWCAPALVYVGFLERPPVDTPPKSYDRYTGLPARFVPALEELGKRADDVRNAAGSERVYLARRGALSRKLVNAPAIEAIAASRGFAIVHPEDLSFPEQAGVIRRAKFVVGPNGSAMYLNFCATRGTKLCVLNYPYASGLLTYTGILQAIGVDVTVFTGPAVRLNNEPGYPYFGLPDYADYTIDEDEFARFLDGWLGS